MGSRWVWPALVAIACLCSTGCASEPPADGSDAGAFDADIDDAGALDADIADAHSLGDAERDVGVDQDAAALDAETPLDAGPADAGSDATAGCARSSDCDDGDECTSDSCGSDGVCVHSMIDVDRDGHAPVRCGGDDCDDTTAAINPDASEACNALDDDCDLAVDEEPASLASCPGGESCVLGACVCDAGLSRCGGACVDWSNDSAHCGGCDVVCSAPASCSGGACTCGGALSHCPGLGCLDLSADPLHCGSCTRSCAAGELCVSGGCVECGGPGQACCEAGACDAGASCMAGTCACVGAFAIACGGVCVDSQTNPSHCGGCSVGCAGDELCSGGSCTSCGGVGEVCCAGSMCTTSGGCVAGRCECRAGQSACGSRCVDLDTDVSACGDCDTACGSYSACLGGSCGFGLDIDGGPIAAVAVDDLGNFYIAGYTAGADLGDGTVRSGPFLASYTSSATLRWVASTGFAGADVSVDAAGNVSVVGEYAGTISVGGTVLTSAGSADVAVASYTRDGTLRWVRSFGGVAADRGHGVVASPAGVVYIVGEFRGTISPGTGSMTSAGENDGFLVAYSSAGSALWARQRGGSGWDAMYHAAMSVAGDLYIAGFSGSGATLARYSSVGSLLWSTATTGGMYSSWRRVSVAPEGVYVAGSFERGPVTIGSTTLMGARQRAMVASFAYGGALRWARAYGETDGSDIAYALGTRASGGGVLVGGGYTGSIDFGGGLLPASSGTDPFVAVLDSTGGHIQSLRVAQPLASPVYASGIAPLGTTRAVVVGGIFTGPSRVGFVRIVAVP